MTVIGVIQTLNEEGRIGDAVTSLFVAGCDEVFVLDGAWTDPDGQTFGGGAQWSLDRTIDEADKAGATFRQWHGTGGDAEKQTALLQHCGARLGDFVVKLDADERLQGTLPDLTGHSLIWLQNHGPNDIPDVRSTWPRGDDADHPIPLLRVFQWHPGMICDTPGRWRTEQGPLEPYKVGALRHHVETVGYGPDEPVSVAYREMRDNEHLTPPEETAAFPILEGCWIDHYRDDRRAESKRAYYEAVA